VASTCSSPPAFASSCWDSRGGGSGSIASSSGAGGSGAGVAEIGSGSFNPKADEVLTQQSQICHQTSQKNKQYIMTKELHLQFGFLYAGLLQS
jgi:hypothetical protein